MTTSMQSAAPRAAPAILVGIASALAVQLMPLMVAIFARSFDFSTAAAGQVTALEMLGVTVGSLLVGGLLTRISVSTIMVVSLLLVVVGNVVTIAAGGSLLEVSRFAAGLGEGAGTATMAAVLAGTDNPVRNFATYIVGSLALATVLFRFEPAITAAAGDMAIFWILVGVGALAIPAALTVKKPEAAAVLGQDSTTAKSKMALVVVALIAMVFYLSAWTNTWAYAVNLGQWAGLSPEASGGILGYAAISGAVGAVLAIVMGQRFGNFIPMLGAGGVMTAAGLMMVLDLTPATFTIGVMAWIAGMQYIGSYFLGVVAAADAEGRAASLSIAAQTLGIAIGPAIGSMVVGRSNATLLVGISLLLLVPSLVALLGIDRLLQKSSLKAPA